MESTKRELTQRKQGNAVRYLLLAALIVGICSLCNDTRGATWLAIPGLLAGAVLLPSGLNAFYDGPPRDKEEPPNGSH